MQKADRKTLVKSTPGRGRWSSNEEEGELYFFKENRKWLAIQNMPHLTVKK